MKKALVVFLLLALVGGSLFAQEGLTWNGRVRGGLGMWKVGDEDATWGIVTPVGSTNGIRLDLGANYTNADKNKGFTTNFRAQGAGTNSSLIFNHENFRVVHAEGWFTAFDNLLRVTGGRLVDSPFGYGDTWWGMGDPADQNYGLMATVNATDDVRIGFGTKASNNLAKGDLFEGVGFFGGVRATLGAIDARGYLDYQKDNVSAHGAGRVNVGDLSVALAVYGWRLDNYSEFGRLWVMPRVAFSGIENLGLSVAGLYGMDNKPDTGDDAAFGAMLGLSYAVGNVIPRLDAGYVSGSSGYDSLMRASIWSNVNYDAGDAYLFVRPAVQFRTSSTSYVNLGVAVENKMGDKKPDNALNMGGFLELNVSF